MKIQLDEKWWITSDEHQYILSCKTKKTFFSKYHFIDLANLLTFYINLKGREVENINTFKELLDYQKNVLSKVIQALSSYNITKEDGLKQEAK